MAALSTIAAIAAIGASAASIGSSLTQKKPSSVPTSPPPTPAVPDPAIAAAAVEAALSRRKGKAPTLPGKAKAAGNASTLLSGASGLTERAPTERKTLLGE